MDGVILDGSFSRDLLAALQQAVERALPRYSWEGVARPALLAGTIGSDARALGGALLPLYANFAPDRELFLKARSRRRGAGARRTVFATLDPVAGLVADGAVSDLIQFERLEFDLLLDQLLDLGHHARVVARSTSVTARPEAPARPVRPMRCT
jgi:hypothetical protein